jgi:hypothetical protein
MRRIQQITAGALLALALIADVSTSLVRPVMRRPGRLGG